MTIVSVKLDREDLVPLPEDVLSLTEKGIVSHKDWPRPSQAEVDLVLSKLDKKYRKRYDRVSKYLFNH